MPAALPSGVGELFCSFILVRLLLLFHLLLLALSSFNSFGPQIDYDNNRPLWRYRSPSMVISLVYTSIWCESAVRTRFFVMQRASRPTRCVGVSEFRLWYPAPAARIASLFCFCFCFFPSHLLFSPFCSLSLLVVTQIRGHIAGSSPPLPTTVRALHFYRKKISALSFLVDSRRTVLTHARRSQQLILFYLFLQKNSKSRHGGIRTHGPTLVAFEGYH